MVQMLSLLQIVCPSHLLMYVLIFCTACDSYEEVKLSIDTPTRGQMIPLNTPVEIQITGKEDSLEELLVNGQTHNGLSQDKENTLFIYQEPSYGLGFVYAEHPNDPYLVVRSWLQGEFIASNSWYPGTISIKLGYTGINDGNDSLAGIIKSSLINVELSQFVEPITVDFGITQAAIVIDSAVIKDMTLTLSILGEQMLVDLVLSPLVIGYRIESNLFNSQGIGTYEQVYINAQADLDKDGVTLVQPRIMSDRLQIDDEQIPESLMNAIADALKDRFESTISQAISEVTHEVTAQLFNQFNPTLGIAFQKPISQESRIASVKLKNNNLIINFETRAAAINRQMTPNYGGTLASPSLDLSAYQEEMSFSVGSGLIHQLLYAAWEAGNFSNLSYTKSELESLGLAELSFPYSNLNKATIDLLLPPTLEWSSEGPVLVLGGVTVGMKVNYSKDTRAWTVARVPIKLTFEQGSLRVSSDSWRTIKTEAIMLDRLNQIAERAEVLKLITIALPSVIDDILSKFPLILIDPIELRALSNGPVLRLFPQVEQLSTQSNHWELGLKLNVSSE